jgi:hypothetical protein
VGVGVARVHPAAKMAIMIKINKANLLVLPRAVRIFSTSCFETDELLGMIGIFSKLVIFYERLAIFTSWS